MTRLHIDIIGQGPALIMIHGWGWHSGIWQPLLSQLMQKYQLFLVDLPGFGKSPLLTTDYTFEKIIPEILSQVPDRAAWLGWSLGGLFATWTAIHFPHRVSHLINIASSPRFVRDADWPGIDVVTLEKFSLLLTENYKKTLLDFLELQLRGSKNRAALFLELQKILFPSEKYSLPALLGGLQLLRCTDLRADLQKVVCPSLSVFGALDTIVPTRVASLLPDLLPQVKCEVILHSGHMPFLTRASEFVGVLDDFIRNNNLKRK